MKPETILDRRWPSEKLETVFNRILKYLPRDVAACEFSENPVEILQKSASSRDIDLREMLQHFMAEDDISQISDFQPSILGMLLHLELGSVSNNKVEIFNPRRPNKRISTYPTPPDVAATMSNYILKKWSDSGRQMTEWRILDPSCECGNLLLPFTKLVLKKIEAGELPSSLCSSFFARRMSGIDVNPLAIALTTSQIQQELKNAGLGNLELESFHVADSVNWLGRKSAGKFSAVISNPPWGTVKLDPKARYSNEDILFSAHENSYIVFLQRCLNALEPGGVFAFVVPFHFLHSRNAGKLRQLFIESSQLDYIKILPRKSFWHASFRACMLLGVKTSSAERCSDDFEFVEFSPVHTLSLDSNKIHRKRSLKQLDELQSDSWLGYLRGVDEFLDPTKYTLLGDLCTIKAGLTPYRVGKGVPPQSREQINDRMYHSEHPAEGFLPIVAGRDVLQYECRDPSSYVLFGKNLASSGNQEKHLLEVRIFVRELIRRDGMLYACMAPSGVLYNEGIFALQTFKQDTGLGTSLPFGLVCILNSLAAADAASRLTAAIFNVSHTKIKVSELRRFPIPNSLLREDSEFSQFFLDGHFSNSAKISAQVSCFPDELPKDKLERWIADAYIS